MMKFTGLVNGGNGGWDPHEKEVEEVHVLINTVDMSLIKKKVWIQQFVLHILL